MNQEWTTLSLERHGAVALLTLNRPEALNTMNRAFWREIIEAFEVIDGQPETRAVVIASTGRHFTAGIDLGDFGGIMMNAGQGAAGRVGERLRRMVLQMQESFSVIERCRVPVIAAVQGGCIGGGVDLVTACDLRTCTENAYFRVQEINIGITADVGTLQRLPTLIPRGVAADLAYTGRKLSAVEALQYGLVNRSYADADALLAGSLALAQEIAQKSPLAIAGTKQVLRFGRDHGVDAGLDYVATWQAGMLLNDDVMEQMQANMERREASFSDLFAALALDE